MSAWRGVLGVRGGKGPIVVVTGVFDDGEPKGFDFHGRCVPAKYVHKGEASYPDLTDPATVGCLLALVREVVSDKRLHCRPSLDYWCLYTGERSLGCANTEAELLVALLENAARYRALTDDDEDDGMGRLD